MDEHAVRRILEGGGGWAGRLIRGGLWLPGAAYGSLMGIRRTAYAAGLLPSARAGLPVISVGNLTAGGTGKTPFVVMLARLLAGRGIRPGILLRGYRRSDEGQSDEESLYRLACPGAVVEAGPDRVAGAARAARAGAEALLLDDGFQHLRLQRDLDIVLIDACAPWGGGMPFPAGLLREPRSALAKADLVAITRSDQRDPEFVRRLRGEIRALAPSAPILAARHRPSGLRLPDGTVLPPAALAGKKVVALSGIARPEAFHLTLAGLGAEVVAVFAGNDHRHFDAAYLEQALAEARKSDAVAVTTEKDWVKTIFSRLSDNIGVDNTNMRVLEVRQEVDDPAALDRLLTGVLDARSAGPGSNGAITRPGNVK